MEEWSATGDFLFCHECDIRPAFPRNKPPETKDEDDVQVLANAAEAEERGQSHWNFFLHNNSADRCT